MIVDDKNSKHVWVRSRSGTPVTVSNSKEQLVIGNEWIGVNPSSGLLSIIMKLNKHIAVSTTDPNAKQEIKVLKKLKVSKDSIDIIQGESAELVVNPEPNIPFPSQLISISEVLNIASTAVSGNKVTVTAHKPGSTVLTHRSGNVECKTKVNVYPVPEFLKKYYVGKPNEPVTLAIRGQNKFTLTCPKGIVQKGNTVVAELPGSYDIVASILGKTISTTVKIEGPVDEPAHQEVQKVGE